MCKPPQPLVTGFIPVIFAQPVRVLSKRMASAITAWFCRIVARIVGHAAWSCLPKRRPVNGTRPSFDDSVENIEKIASRTSQPVKAGHEQCVAGRHGLQRAPCSLRSAFAPLAAAIRDCTASVLQFEAGALC